MSIRSAIEEQQSIAELHAAIDRILAAEDAKQHDVHEVPVVQHHVLQHHHVMQHDHVLQHDRDPD